MMLPSTLPIVFLLAKSEADGRTGLRPGASIGDPVQFLFGYLGLWTLAGILAYVAPFALVQFYPRYSAAAGLTGLGSGIAIAFAGLYQVSPVKEKALRECRSPVTFLMARWRTGALGRLRMGLEYSFFCTKCCWALMVILVLVGTMSLVWMAFFAGVILAEKILPHGLGFSKAFGVLLVAVGAAISIVALA